MTERQHEIVEFLRATAALKVPPSMRQIADRVGVSVRTVYKDLHALAEEGIIERVNPDSGRRSRAVWRVQ